MSDTERITKLERELREALNRIGELEGKVETMRGNINANFDGHARVLSKVCGDLKIAHLFTFRNGIDVARGH